MVEATVKEAMISPMDKFMEQYLAGKYINEHQEIDFDVLRRDLELFHNFSKETAAETYLALLVFTHALKYYDAKSGPVSFASTYTEFAEFVTVVGELAVKIYNFKNNG